MKTQSWGRHLLLDCLEGDMKNISDKSVMVNFIHDLVKEIDMVAYGLPFIERFATHDDEKAGISFCQMIETSNITGHFVEKTGNFCIDIFSCKDFNVDDVLKIVNKYFSPREVTYHIISRNI